MATVEDNPEKIEVNPTVLGYELNSEQHVVSNYLVPSLVACFLYVLNFASDFTVAYRHYHENNVAWGGLTIFFMYLPIIGCYIITISSTELWPDIDDCTHKNLMWILLKTAQHLCFPIWSMWRFAEKIFWSIESYRSDDEDEKEKILKILSAPRSVELYYFLQGYLQAAPQILFQMHLLMRFVPQLDRQTVDAQVCSIVISIAQMAKTTTLFQRFSSQKIAGKCYPWYKPYKALHNVTRTRNVDQTDSASSYRRSVVVYHCRASHTSKRDSNNKASSCNSNHDSVEIRQHNVDDKARQNRRSSDFYEQPSSSYLERLEREKLLELGRETSVIGGPERLVLRAESEAIDEVDFFNPKRLFKIKGLLEDDIAGKTISFLWWFCFLMARMLAISSFGYFYPKDILWLLASHYILVIALLLYDVRHDEVRRAKAIFFIFIGYVYLFCLIEFKIIFKKPKFVYNGFFILMFVENFVMITVWWYCEAVKLEDTWWYTYIFNIVVICSVLSFVTMLLYITILKPKEVVVQVIPK